MRELLKVAVGMLIRNWERVMKIFRTVWLILLGPSVIGLAAADSDTAFFENKIAPILEQRC